ncbi:cryptochrome/photolyase family protein [Dokdonella immobilis]|uniref:Deoxyribodipyrimidine photo-lyase n=1 Tax=Dokdonella immobilis TaxID=578942 RepID=A0A1I4VA28_9GAMM|nr:deoxyribodipyrimidine photo-lyase [Dokdonella immobilis]SFM98052.1 deoxyribodipyrimidine photo-lyase [Dokdonella immobilis]
MSTALVWFRRDLRLADNPALAAARDAHEQVIPIYVHAPDEEAPWQPGAASRWWLHHSLVALHADLRRRGSGLHIAKGPSLQALREILEATRASAIYWNRLYEPAITARDRTIKQALLDDGVDARSFKATVLFEPWEVQTGQDQPYRVFTPFWRKARADLQVRPPLPVPDSVPTVALDGSLAVDDLDLLPRLDWDAGFYEAWVPGESGALDAFDRFLESAVTDYAKERDRPDRESTSRLSPHLHFGEISPMQIAWELDERARPEGQAARSTGAEKFLSEIGWREFSVHLLFHFPDMPEKNLNARFDEFRWGEDDPEAILRWKQGRTGIPMIDAGMRELWATGIMHNRVRMLVASFLTKNLRQHWRHGAAWFWDTLVDADLANNSQGWQWTAGCGVDAAPYFRIFNPVTQGEKFDPDGVYVRRWVPELADLPASLIHHPWTEPDCLEATGYPPPMVDLAESRQGALAAYQDLPKAGD